MTAYHYSLLAQIGARLRRLPVREIKRCLQLAREHQLPLSAQDLEAHCLAGGRIGEVVEAMVFAAQNHLTLSWQTAAAVDLAQPKKGSVITWTQACHRRDLRDLDSAFQQRFRP